MVELTEGRDRNTRSPDKWRHGVERDFHGRHGRLGPKPQSSFGAQGFSPGGGSGERWRVVGLASPHRDEDESRELDLSAAEDHRILTGAARWDRPAPLPSSRGSRP